MTDVAPVLRAIEAHALQYLVGVLPFEELQKNNWWNENGNSLILMPEAIIEDMEIRKLKKKSLELAGLFD